MTDSTPEDVRSISLDELDEWLARAHDEQWQELALIGPGIHGDYARQLIDDGWPAGHVVQLDEELAVGVTKLASLTGLSSLNLASNNIGDEGARALASLTGLTSLNLWNNNIGDEGGRALASLTGLTLLILGFNSVGDEGARALASLTGLTSLNLYSNNIGAEGACALAPLTGLTLLDLHLNEIGDEGARAVLQAWAESPGAGHRRFLDLRENGDLSALLPAEVLESTDAQTILAAFRRFRAAETEETLRPLNEAKLLVVGNEAVGKTSLIRYLIENKPRDPDEKKTPGINIVTRPWTPQPSPVKLNVWDFGGQVIMQGTHRFFLTARSLYLLVLEDRREDDRSVYEWLKIIKARGGASPVIVVINKCDDPQCHNLRLDEVELRRNYPNIVEFVRTSCEDNEDAAASIAQLRERIADVVTRKDLLPHVHDSFPESWLRVKTAVAEKARDERVLPMRDFWQLCEHPDSTAEEAAESITDRNEQLALLGLLHDLGVVVAHGLDRGAPAALREITLLDPNWLTTAIYTLLNSPAIRDQDGEFARGQLDELLDEELYPHDRHEFILSMMQHQDVGLCFPLADTKDERYLIPEALPRTSPEDYRSPADPLRFRFRYDFLPSGLMPRFIVQAHRNLADAPNCWHAGVVLRAVGCQIHVRGDVDGRCVDIEVDGPHARRRSALNVVINDLEFVHDRYAESNPAARVPLPDNPDLDVLYDHLIELEEEEESGYAYRPENATRKYQVSELLEGVRRENVKQGTGDIHNYYGDYFEGGKKGDDMSKTYKTTLGDAKGNVTLIVGENINQVTAEKIEGSFNRAASASDVSDDIKATLRELVQQVALMIEALPAEQADETADALETLTKEAIRAEPRRKWWELSSDGIREAAKSVGSVGAVAIDLLTKLGPMIGF